MVRADHPCPEWGRFISHLFRLSSKQEEDKNGAERDAGSPARGGGGLLRDVPGCVQPQTDDAGAALSWGVEPVSSFLMFGSKQDETRVRWRRDGGQPGRRVPIC